MVIRCVGIDLAWSPRNTSGGFALEVEQALAHEIGWCEALGDDDEVIAFIARMIGEGPALVAIDAPLAVPNEKGARPCDRKISRVFGRFEAGAHPASRRTLRRYGGLRAEKLAQRLTQEQSLTQKPHIGRQESARQLVEVYPHPGIVTLFELEKSLKYKRGPVARRRMELSRLQQHLSDLANSAPALCGNGAWRRDIAHLRGRCLKRYEDLLDSLFCAYTVAYCWYHGPTHYEIFGSVKEGHILVPIPPEGRPRLGLPAAQTPISR